MKLINPFSLYGYIGPEYFCNRKTESARIISNARNGINTTLLSVRRMGKTGIIQHVFRQLSKQKNTKCIYIDIYATQNLNDFTNSIATSVFNTFTEKETIGKKFKNFIVNLRPIISFDPLTGNPEVRFEFVQKMQTEQSLIGIFQFLEKQNIQIIIAIDEFQQISNYPEKNIEALLRTHIQVLKNIHFIFSGSNKHVLIDMFSNNKRPFFSSTHLLNLYPIGKNDYSQFIEHHFNKDGKKIEKEAIAFICDWTNLHTFYTQFLANRVYSLGIKNIKTEDVQLACAEILREQESVFFQYRNMLTENQWNLLRAIAIENKVYQPSSRRMIESYQIGTAANIKRGLDSLLNKEMIYKEEDENGSYYRVYDCFLARWLARL